MNSDTFLLSLSSSNHFPQILLASQTFRHFKVFADGISNVRQPLLFSGGLDTPVITR